jgi:hypothetical protein
MTPESTHDSAHAYGTQAATRYPGKSWDEIEADLRRGWETPEQHVEGIEHKLEADWDEVKEVVHDAWKKAARAD